NLRSNMMVANRHIINNFLPGAITNGFEYRLNLNVSYQFNNDLAFEFFCNYNSSVMNVQGRQPSFIFYIMSFSKQFMNKKASLALTAANPFNKYVGQRSELTGPNFTSISFRQIPLRSFGLSFTYKCGKLEFIKPREDDMNNQVPGIPGS